MRVDKSAATTQRNIREVVGINIKPPSEWMMGTYPKAQKLK